MELETTLKQLFEGLGEQYFSYSESLFSGAFAERLDYLSGTKLKVFNALNTFNKKFVSYDHIDKDAFQSALSYFQNKVDERMLVSWKYSSGSLVLVGLMFADDLNDSEIKTLFTRFDDGIVNIMRKQVGKVFGGEDGATYGTMMLIFSDSSKAQHFNDNIKKYYGSHFLKQTYTSVISIDCTAETLTQGKALLGAKWTGGIDISLLKRKIFNK